MIDAGSGDNCLGDIELELSRTEFTCDDIGDNTVTLTATDECGNTNVCSAVVTVLRGVDPPKVTSTTYCIEKLVEINPGIRAECTTCEVADILWFDAEFGGNQVGSGEFFNPITAGLITQGEIGCFTYYAECGCSTTACRSLRTPGVFKTMSCDVECEEGCLYTCLLYTSPSPRDGLLSRMPSSA